MGIRDELILEVFFAAMMCGYANSAKKETIAALPGSKVIPFEIEDFKVLDCYLVTPDNPYSFGQTIIWHKNVPIWVMSYQGLYLKRAIPFLKLVLWQTYSRQQFVGGRGPRFFVDSGMTYMNRVEPPNVWRHFRGREEVYDRDGRSMGWHDYQGLRLAQSLLVK